MSRLACLLTLAVAFPSVLFTADASFKKIQLTKEYFAEGANVGDFNKDGKPDIVSGPHWFEGPSFEKRHRFYDGKSYPDDRGYSNNFFSYVHDIDDDGWDDVLMIGLPGTAAHWFRNSKGDKLWEKHLAFPNADNEAPIFDDLTGDGKPELICTFQGKLGFAQPDETGSTKPWKWTSISEKGPWHRFSHGLGIGDINGDGRKDFLAPQGWWEQPESLDGETTWKHHPFTFCPGGAEMYAYDVDGDGDNDVITSLHAHAWGLSWWEQKMSAAGISFVEHRIMGSPKDKGRFPHDVAFSQLHAIDLEDIDGDGLKDFVTGKCYWAHNGGDPGARDPAVVYWFKLVRGEGGATFVPRLIDDASGVGRQVVAKDVNGDGLRDVVAANKKGTHVFLQQKKKD